MKELTVRLAGLVLKNPLVLGSSDLTVSEQGMLTFARAGFGAIVSKTTTIEPLEGNPKPHLYFEKDRYLLVSGGLPNPGYKVMAERISAVKDAVHGEGCLIIASLAGRSPEEHAVIARELEQAGADAIQANIYCPHRGPLVGQDEPIGRYWALDPDRAAEVTRAVKAAVRIPVFMKYPGEYVWDSPRLGLAIERAGADGQVIPPHPGGMLIDPATARPRIGNPEGTGAVCGEVFKPMGIKCAADMVRVLKTPVVGSGGVTRGLDVVEYLMVGARAVELCTAMYWYGPGSLPEMLRELQAFLDQSAYSSLEDMIGAALPNLPRIPYACRKLGLA
ncbi:MAG: hypothetical protein QME70_04250 [Bacillota bacterium]|nr:hypothetical protein [Bacillota bacterium]